MRSVVPREVAIVWLVSDHSPEAQPISLLDHFGQVVQYCDDTLLAYLLNQVAVLVFPTDHVVPLDSVSSEPVDRVGALSVMLEIGAGRAEPDLTACSS